MRKIIDKFRNIYDKFKRKKLAKAYSIAGVFVATILMLSIGYSAFGIKVNISNIITDVVIKKDVRISGVRVATNEEVAANVSLVDSGNITLINDGTSKYNEYNVNNISVGIDLPNETSSITYKVSLINLGNAEVGILSIDGLPSNITYKLSGLDLKEKICDSNNKCNLGIEKEFYITFYYVDGSYDLSDTEHDLNLEFDFRKAYTVTYEGITNNGYPDGVLEGDTLEVTFTSPIPPKVVPYINDEKVINYTYENNKITVYDITGDIVLKYIEKVYLAALPKSTYFKTSDYINNIKTASFVKNVDIPSDALITYDLEENNGDEIKGWVDTDYNLYIGSEWNIYATDLSYAFDGMTKLTGINFDNINTSQVTNMKNMFRGTSNLAKLDLSGFNTSLVRDMTGMFQNASKLTELNISNFNTSEVRIMSYMFNGVSSLTNLDVSSFNTANVQNMRDMFNKMSSLKSLDVTNFNTANVQNMGGMFEGLKLLTSLDLSSFNTDKVQYMFNMFSGMSGITSLDLSNFNTSKIQSFSYMFNGMSNLISLNISNFDTSNVTTMEGMFNGMGNLTNLDLSSFNTSSVTNTNYMFNMNNKLVTVYVSDLWDMSSVTSSKEMMNRCDSIVGGNGTKYNNSYIDKTYARVDTAETPGYLTLKNI